MKCNPNPAPLKNGIELSSHDSTTLVSEEEIMKNMPIYAQAIGS
jgi:hypothetical protein